MKSRFNLVVCFEPICACVRAGGQIRFGAVVDANGIFNYTLECATCGTNVWQPIVGTPVTVSVRQEPGPRAFVAPTQAKGRA